MSVRFASALLLALLAVGCSGELDPLTEEIEVRELGLASLSIERPPGTLDPLVINPGDTLDFTLAGLDAGGGAVDVGAAGRRWRVSDGRFASIDENGRLVGLADGPVMVDVRIGDVVAGFVDVQVLTSAATSVERIVPLDLDTVGGTLDPCVPERYVAQGGFAVGPDRLLRNVTWGPRNVGGVDLRPLEGGAVDVTASAAGASFDLTAAAGGGSGSLAISVGSTLTSLEIRPGDALVGTVGATRDDLTAIGTYTGGNGGADREIDVTESVDWRVETGAEFAAVSNARGSRGEVTARAAGNATIVASCGDTDSESRDFRVTSTTSSSSSDDDELAILGAGEDGTRRVIDSSVEGQVQFRVSRGSTYDEDEDVTNQAQWQVLSNGDTSIGTITSDGLGRGLFVPNSEGTGQIVVTFGGLTATLDITVI